MKKRYWIPLLILLILIGFRIALPFWVINYVNKTLEEIPGYTGSIQDVDIYLFRGAYAIDSLYIDKIDANNDVPFLAIPRIDLSVEWSALWNGAIVGEVLLQKPEVNFVADDEEFGLDVDWTVYVNELLPIQINRFAIEEGRVRYLDFSTEPQIDLALNNLELEILNINNAENNEERLPTKISLYATSIGAGILKIEADANLIKKIPDVDLNFEFEEVHLPDLNEFLEAYVNVDAESGDFFLYSEIVIDEGVLDGYVKPIITDLRILNLEEGDVLEVAWEAMVGFVTEVFENQPQDQLATQVPLSGDLNELEAGIFPAIWNIFRNAFIESLSKTTEGDVDFGLDEDTGEQ